ncbi:hypothetical protein SEA_BRUHMOMENT_49 [Arthrobacter phage BruhMoment]|nr:hypothetical protein SEA_BRUHMOMENT_49 [Arthrobacter phage BruhMoment]
MAEREIGYVVVEFNQASFQPAIASALWEDYDDADRAVKAARIAAKVTGRRERYAVGTVTVEEEE